MDSDMSGWVIEFLLRSSVPDSTIQKTLAALPLSGADPRLKKTLLLRTLHSHLINASLSETALEILELLEQLHLNDAVPVPDSLRRAYCAVAVECTVKYLAASPDDPSGEYFSAVRRIWRGRVAALSEAGRASGLVSDDLERWRDDVEAALWDPRVSERIAGLNTRWVAMVEVRGYLKEAWEIMGASFLDLMATGSKGKGLCLGGVCENDSVRKRGDGGLECSAKRADSLEGVCENDSVRKCGDGGIECSAKRANRNEIDDNDGLCLDGVCENDSVRKRGGGGLECSAKCADRNEVDDNEGLRLEGACENDSVRKHGDGGLECSGKRADMNEFDDNEGLHLEGVCENDSVRKCGGGGGLECSAKRADRSEFDDNEGLCLEGVCENDSVRKHGDGGLECSAKRADRNEVDGNDDNGTDDGACRMEGVTVTEENQGKEQFEDTVDVPAKGNQVQKENIQLKRKQFVLQKCHRGVQISGAEEVVPKKSRSNCDPLPSAEVKKVRESLRSSSLELQAVVTDPLPDALHASEVVRSQLSMKDTKHEPHIIENQSGDAYLPDPDACRSIVPFLPNNADLRKESSVHCSNVDRPNLMERRSNAQTYEWNDSIDNLPQVIQPRRRKLKWTSLEEETLRAGVKMFGGGNWKAIRDFYSNIFENRSAVDLKDKWRNMLR
ncbi:uncharacterized protein LOC130722323 [Lotus japonicus]|uniref:uncharacterized protein LOC130722323 n=1 Tax=Lotus japonicus TaxID=34305 RepID=UPI0025911708|nr:uncharacterized protein LOC130722323 [Lotus japonicus]